jgi:hypothetical protein
MIPSTNIAVMATPELCNLLGFSQLFSNCSLTAARGKSEPEHLRGVMI